MTTKLKVLFVDDEKKFADAMSQVLRLQGFDVRTAYSGRLALQLYSPGEFDLVVTDLSMPGMDGIELIRELRKTHPPQKIIVVTAFPSQRSQEQAFTLGTLHYIAKPFTPKRFMELVEDSLHGPQLGLLGSVRLSAEDLIQLYSFIGKTIVLEILKGKNGESGKIFFDKGQVVHAETTASQGKKAFHEILEWKSGMFKVDDPPDEFPQTITESVNSLLLEIAKDQDENNDKT